MSNFNQLYNIGKSIAEAAKDEYGNSFIGPQKIKNLINSDHLVQLLMTKVPNVIDKIKTIYIAYFVLNQRLEPSQIENILNNLYVLEVDIYEDKNRIYVTCDMCDGDGEIECRYCDGDGNIDCRYCDGDGEIECYECDGDGNEECRYCDGSGTETDTEEDDEGEEVEVEVSCGGCSGSGNEECRSCGGDGTFECSECEGKGTEKCDECEGYGKHWCEYCEEGYTESNDEYYKVETRNIVMYGTSGSKYVDKVMTLSEFEDIESDPDIFEYDMTINSTYHQNEDTNYEDERSNYDMDDDFVIVNELTKLENFNGHLKV